MYKFYILFPFKKALKYVHVYHLDKSIVIILYKKINNLCMQGKLYEQS